MKVKNYQIMDATIWLHSFKETNLKFDLNLNLKNLIITILKSEFLMKGRVTLWVSTKSSKY
jgi:hypothetical protein